MKYLRDALYTILIVLVQAMIGFWEIAIFSPGVLDTRPIYVFGIAFELLLAAFGVLFGAFVGSRSEHAGEVVPPLIGLVIAFGLVYASAAAPIRFGVVGAWPWDLVFTVGIPNAVAVIILGWSILVARRMSGYAF
jgi:hypothetical protein